MLSLLGKKRSFIKIKHARFDKSIITGYSPQYNEESGFMVVIMVGKESRTSVKLSFGKDEEERDRIVSILDNLFDIQ